MARYVFQKAEGYSVLDKVKEIRSALEGMCDAGFNSLADFTERVDKQIDSRKVYLPEKVTFDVNEELVFSIDQLPVFFNNKGGPPYGVHQIGILKKVE